MHDLPHCLDLLITVAKQAGRRILPMMKVLRKDLRIRYKKDGTLLTAADLEANRCIQVGLGAVFPEIPMLSEEARPAIYWHRRTWSAHWLVDPLDGTRAFVNGFKDFTVNIALIEDQIPILGVIYAPALDICYYAARGHGAFKQVGDNGIETVIRTKPMDWENSRILLGRYFQDRALLRAYKATSGVKMIHRNSSLKLGLLAEGVGDIYPRFGKTGEWDTAAGQCIVEMAGGAIIDFEGRPLRYNTKSSLINPPFIAVGDAEQGKRAIEFALKKRVSVYPHIGQN